LDSGTATPSRALHEVAVSARVAEVVESESEFLGRHTLIKRLAPVALGRPRAARYGAPLISNAVVAKAPIATGFPRHTRGWDRILTPACVVYVGRKRQFNVMP
jgi:hypothetical protein